MLHAIVLSDSHNKHLSLLISLPHSGDVPLLNKILWFIHILLKPLVKFLFLEYILYVLYNVIVGPYDLAPHSYACFDCIVFKLVIPGIR